MTGGCQQRRQATCTQCAHPTHTSYKYWVLLWLTLTPTEIDQVPPSLIARHARTPSHEHFGGAGLQPPRDELMGGD